MTRDELNVELDKIMIYNNIRLQTHHNLIEGLIESSRQTLKEMKVITNCLLFLFLVNGGSLIALSIMIFLK